MKEIVNGAFTEYGWIDEDGIEWHNKVKKGYIIAKRQDGKCLVYKATGYCELVYAHKGTSGDALPTYNWTEAIYDNFEEAEKSIK